MSVLKSAASVLLAVLQMLFASVSYKQIDAPAAEKEEVPAVVNDIDGDTPLADSIKYAKTCEDVPTAAYTTGKRRYYGMKNSSAYIAHDLTSLNNKTATVYDLQGKTYVKNSFDPYYKTAKGKTRFASKSSGDARVNTIRLGEYYYECHVRDLGFALNKSRTEFLFDKCYHLYADKVYEQLSLLAYEATEELDTFGTQIKIPVKTVSAIQIKDKNGIHSTLDNVDAQSVEYAAFDITGVGVFGIIIPSDGSTKEVTVTKKGQNYIIDQTAEYTPGTGINKYDETGGYELNCVTFGRRIYTDSTHTFDKIDKEAYIERNPLTAISVGGTNSDGKYIGYDALRGAYTFTCSGVSFNLAFEKPELQLFTDISFVGDSLGRDIMIRMNGTHGCLEAGALLDKNRQLVPINVQISKNFKGDGGEEFYSVIDYEYGDSFFPLHINKDEKLDFTLLNLYQNWGKFPLKQLSSIEFYRSYYHLSTGVTESNCIAIYGSSAQKDGWLLPDFRGASSPYWDNQPQHNSVGILGFVNFKNKILGLFDAKSDYGEYAYGNIASVGQTYSDITDYYNADCGAYSYSLRHVEFPQTDENRTFYQVNIKFNTDMTFKNFKRDFSFFYMNGRDLTFDNFGYLNENNEETVSAITAKEKNKYVTLGSESPYFGFFNATEETEYHIDEYFGSNCAVIVRSFNIVKDGKKYDVPLAVRENCTKSKSEVSLTLDAKKIKFSKGDTISLDMILLPWGTGRETNDQNVRDVRFDSALNAQRAVSDTNEILGDAVIPTVKSSNNKASFTLSGGRNNVAVKVGGFTRLARPDVTVECGGEKKKLALPSSNGYDGYSVIYEDDGTYTYSFICDIDDPEAQYNISVELK